MPAGSGAASLAPRIALAASWVGLLAAAYAVRLHAAPRRVSLFCGGGGGCSEALQLGSWGPVGLAHLGLAFFCAMSFASWAAAAGSLGPRGARLARALAGAGAATGLLLLGVQLRYLEALCALCCTTTAATLVLGLAWLRVDPGSLVPGPPRATGRGAAAALALSAGASLALASWWEARQENRVVLRLGDHVVVREDMARELAYPLHQLRMIQHQLEREWLERRAAEHVLGEEARRRGLTPAELLERELGAGTHSGTEPADTVSGPDAAPAAEEIARREHAGRRERERELARSLHARYGVELRLALPPSPRVELAARFAQRVGPDAAEAVLTVFSSPFCRYCERLQETLAEVRRRFPGLAVDYRVEPVGHEPTDDVACALAYMGRRGRFLELYRRLAAAGAPPDRSRLAAHAAELGVSQARFLAEFRTPEVVRWVEEAHEDARRIGVHALPTCFLDGVPVGAGPELVAAVEDRLDASSR